MADLQVDPAALEMTAKGINDAITELEAVGFAEAAGTGRGFSYLEMTGMEIGSQRCKDAFDDFCERWALRVRELVQEGNEIADRLNLSAGLYHQQEEYLNNALKYAVNAGMGNPNLTEDQVSAQSWGQTWSDNAYTQFANADYSADSMRAAMVHSEASMKGLQADFDRTVLEDEDAAKAADARANALNEQYRQMPGATPAPPVPGQAEAAQPAQSAGAAGGQW
ncbi:hypothetical protein [Kitasatospora setae]|uniref:hypothetical protein n=1 Tax=Kitasatospora setae TaxID=2066 RepID=UPI00068BB029|nr:hypothetical protein [Kitasatospora setae]